MGLRFCVWVGSLDTSVLTGTAIRLSAVQRKMIQLNLKQTNKQTKQQKPVKRRGEERE